MKKLGYFLLGGFFYIGLVLLWGRQYQILTVQAKELTEDIESVNDGYISLDEEIESDNDSVLQDYKGTISLNEVSESDNNTSDNSDYTQGDNVLDDTQENAENVQIMNDDQFRIMCIFCFGLCAGIIVGHFLTGFIK